MKRSVFGGLILQVSAYTKSMDQIANLPRSIAESVLPTVQAFEPLLRENAAAIRSTRKETFPYGNDPRQQLDVYYPTERRRPSMSSSSTPVLIFMYGGGLVRGDRTLQMADGLPHSNIGYFFAERYGYTTIIPDYRLISHGARFPSGGEDLSLVVDWVRETLSRSDGFGNIDLFIMGNSAGGIHLSTYLLAPDFAASRAKVATRDPDTAVALRGVVLLSVPFNFRQAHPSRVEILQTYFGEEIEARQPQGLLRSAMLQDPDNVLLNVRAMVLNGTLDPDDEILDPKTEFLSLWKEMDEDSYNSLTVEMMEGQNHISPYLSLGTGLDREEAWGRQVAAFCDSLRS